MRTLPVEMPRSRRFELSAPIYKSSMGFIVKDYRRDEFQSWENIRELGDSLRIGVEDTPGSIARLRMFTENDNIVPIESMEEQLKLLKSGDESIDAIADMAEEGAAWGQASRWGLPTPTHPPTGPAPGPSPLDEEYWLRVKEQFPLAPGLILMNAANLCPSPFPIQEAVFRYTRDVDGDASFQNRAKFGELRTVAREALIWPPSRSR